ncbi:hypothetical protein [Chromatium okenii]|uniref:Uncharacterized protein n=1 Tax=Chromatium okenii TaxID=61644 RepID=A0A2S7XTF2_9GAMM|nr:hypothetical protein [Chromatium okenii]PQJ96768.1 hypothetical protein CXB77_06080 [Chromatium okenii]
MAALSNAERQRRYRENLQNKGLANLSCAISAEAAQRLNELATSNNASIAATLESLILNRNETQIEITKKPDSIEDRLASIEDRLTEIENADQSTQNATHNVMSVTTANVTDNQSVIDFIEIAPIPAANPAPTWNCQQRSRFSLLN